MAIMNNFASPSFYEEMINWNEGHFGHVKSHFGHEFPLQKPFPVRARSLFPKQNPSSVRLSMLPACGRRAMPSLHHDPTSARGQRGRFEPSASFVLLVAFHMVKTSEDRLGKFGYPNKFGYTKSGFLAVLALSKSVGCLKNHAPGSFKPDVLKVLKRRSS